MPMIRTFIAIDLPQTIQKELKRFQEELRKTNALGIDLSGDASINQTRRRCDPDVRIYQVPLALVIRTSVIDRTGIKAVVFLAFSRARPKASAGLLPAFKGRCHIPPQFAQRTSGTQPPETDVLLLELL